MRKMKNRAAAVGAAALASAVLLLTVPALAADAARRGLELCARTVIPSLFPFMVLAGLLTRSGIGRGMARACGRPMRALFGVGGAGAPAILLGAFCGFPVGAVSAAELTARGELARVEAARVLAVCSLPSAAFLISTLGEALFGSRRTGWAVAGCVWGAGLICGMAGKFLIGGQTGEREDTTEDAENGPPIPVSGGSGTAGMLTSAVSSAAAATVSVCAYVVFFSCLTGCLGAVLPPRAGAVVRAFFELTSGVSAAASLPDRRAGLVLAAGAAGWAGVSVQLQVAAAVGGRIPLRPYLASKAAQAVVAAGLCLAATAVFPSLTAAECIAAPAGSFPVSIGWWGEIPRAWAIFADLSFALSAAFCGRK